ncbi:MAG: protein kinase [Candidatus Contendobacter sp.]
MAWIAAGAGIAISRQVAQALAYAHAQQPSMVHRDIKPHNILIEDDTGWVVMDFDIAKLLGEQPTQRSSLEELKSQFGFDPAVRKEERKPQLDPVLELEQALRRGKSP